MKLHNAQTLRHLVTGLVTGLVLAGPAGAQLRIGEALALAVEHHPSVQAKRNELRGANERLDASEWQRYPSVSLQTSAAQPNSGSDSIGSVRVDQPLWAGGRIDADIAASEARKLAATAALLEAEQQILVRTASAFAEMIRLQLRMEATEENIQEHQRLLELIQRRAGSQINPDSDVIMARARLEQARSEGIQFRNMAANARADLEQLIGRTVTQLTIPSHDMLPLGTLESSVKAAVAYAPALLRIESELRAAQADVETRKAVYWPTLSARFERIAGGQTAYSTSYLALTFQPGAGLSAQSAIQEALARQDAAQNNLDSARKDLIDKVRIDWNQRHTTLADALVLAELVGATQAMYESFMRQFPVGRKSWLELLNARREATQARYSLADARWSGFLAAIKVAVATGQVAANHPLISESTAQP